MPLRQEVDQQGRLKHLGNRKGEEAAADDLAAFRNGMRQMADALEHGNDEPAA